MDPFAWPESVLLRLYSFVFTFYTNLSIRLSLALDFGFVIKSVRILLRPRHG